MPLWMAFWSAQSRLQVVCAATVFLSLTGSAKRLWRRLLFSINHRCTFLLLVAIVALYLVYSATFMLLSVHRRLLLS